MDPSQKVVAGPTLRVVTHRRQAVEQTTEVSINDKARRATEPCRKQKKQAPP